ncbi:holocytochrome c synthase [Tulasnella sp. 419]|nr:holocytochrome c synthase [Tulasnella sp. 418]KAG8966799.1 holocytochrome c synthase [Tulasnella sp. 419]
MGQSSSSQQLPAQHATATPPPSCPMHQKSAEPTTSAAKCPIAHDKQELNPHNQMPHDLSQLPAPNQALALPTERVSSSIPRADESGGKWEYPSPQQFYNALVRKGWETPEEHVETMVEIHNFLNEEAWTEVQKWEKRWGVENADNLELARLQGRPGELSPKARLHLFAGWLFPSKFNTEPPFDRHDWIIRRPSTGEEVRYVIDYYSAPPEPDGSPVFSLDVRPALDSVGSVKQRISVATEEAWRTFRESQ